MQKLLACFVLELFSLLRTRSDSPSIGTSPFAFLSPTVIGLDWLTSDSKSLRSL
jgi:hypothetical protein